LPDQKPWEDEVLREVHEAREAYAAEHGFHLDRIYADLKSREAKSRLRRTNQRPLARALSFCAAHRRVGTKSRF
jgi:hypothetical protein